MTTSQRPTNGAAGKGYAIETRAESMKLRIGGDSTRQGEVHVVHAGGVERFEDAVYGEEKATIKDELVEESERGSAYAAETLELTVNGRMSVSAVGWPENKLSGEDAILLGGAMAETWTGGALIAAAMSDDLIVGGGVRVTAPVDVWVNGLTGFQERPGTAQADAVLRELYGTLFEREYGAGTHVASVASFTGTVYQTQKAGFRPLMKTALGVRNLIPAAAPGVAPEPSPPAPPPGPEAGATAGAGTMVATNAGAGAAGSARSVDNFQDMGRVANAAEDMENAASLHRAEATADTLDDLAATARVGDADAPETVNQTPSANATQRLEVDNPYGRIGALDDPSAPIDDIDEPIPELMGLDFNDPGDARRLDGSEVTDIVQPGSEGQIDLSARLDDVDGGFDTEFNHDLSRPPDGKGENLAETSVTDGIRLDVSGDTNTSALEPPDARVVSAQPSLDDSGTGWSVVGDSGGSSPHAAESSTPTQGNYQHMPSRESGVSPGSGSASGNAQTPANVSFERRVPDDFDCLVTQAELDRVYFEHRDASNWRAVEAYGVVNDLRDDLRVMVRDLGGYVGDGDLERLYVEIHRLRTKSVLDGNVATVQKIDRFFDWYHLKVYDASTNLAGRADEFDAALTGVSATQLLDPDIDKAKLQQWLLEQRDAALARLNHVSDLNDSQIETMGREFPYYHQLWLALEEGRDPIVESLDEISYLRSVNNIEQGDEYMKYHNQFIAMLREPAFRVGSPATVDPTDLVRPGLESVDAAMPPPAGDLQTTVMDPQLNEPDIAASIGGSGEVAAGNFGSNQQILNALAGAEDLAQPPTSQPHWMASVPLREILFPTGDPGLEHLIEGSLASGSIADIFESTESVAAAENSPLGDGQHPEAAGYSWDPGVGNDPLPRFGAKLASTNRPHGVHGVGAPRFGWPQVWWPGHERDTTPS